MLFPFQLQGFDRADMFRDFVQLVGLQLAVKTSNARRLKYIRRGGVCIY